jgi:broad specificity phosphatase PhoE
MTTNNNLQTLWLLRHGERSDLVDQNWLKTATRPFDPPLTEKGIKQAQQTAEYILSTGTKLNHVFSSPFLRCMQTANEVAKRLQIPIKIEYGLSEWLKAAWFTELPCFDHATFDVGSYPHMDHEYQSFYRDKLTYPESVGDLENKYVSTTKELHNMYGDDHILLVTHGYGVQILTEMFDPKATVMEVPYCALTKLVRLEKERWFAAKVASDAHLL